MLHADFKQRSRGVKAIVRSGDFTAYANILLVSGAGPRWFVEQA
jgi:D-ribose pyranose/furanose isomerase RbsD